MLGQETARHQQSIGKFFLLNIRAKNYAANFCVNFFEFFHNSQKKGKNHVEKRGKKFHSPEKKGNGFFTKATILASRHRNNAALPLW
jgi:hypothetical protein